MASEIKIPRIRSVAYPSLSLSDCIELTSSIYKIFGGATHTARETIAKQLGVSESHLQTQVSSCVQFGLLELRSKEGYKPTDLYIIARNPMPGEELKDAYIEMITKPPLYKAIIDQFNKDHLPQEAGLATLLFRKHKVADKAAPLAAKVFIQSIIQCGFLDQENWILDMPSKGEEKGYVQVIDEKPKDQILYLPAKGESFENPSKTPESEPIEILLDGGRKAQLYMPNDYSKKDLERVMKIIEIYIE